jgi:hypothetical protein
MTKERAASTRGQERLLGIVILAVVAAYIAFGLKTASNSLGCDFLAYYTAATHWFAGQPIYDLTVASTGTCGTYQYPPPFVLIAAPFSTFGFEVGNWLWIGFLIGCWALGTAILPLRLVTRWTILLLGAIGWPLIYGVRIGQVAPILYLIYAFAWRNLDRPLALGASVAAGVLVKLQPGLLAVWLVTQRAWRALFAALVVGLAVVVVCFVIGLGDWFGLLTLLRALTDAVSVTQNLAIGATLHHLGLDTAVAGAVQTVNTVAILLVVVVAGLRLPRTPGFLVAVIATQLISPIVWSHYALILLLPVAWLLDRRQWWAALIPAIQIWVLVPFVGQWTYTVVFYATLIAVFAVGWRARHEPEDAVSPTSPTSPSTPQTSPSSAAPEPAA